MKMGCLSFSAAVCACSSMSVGAAVFYVSLDSTNPTPPYSSWTTAATNIQDAVDLAAVNDLVLVTNGVYLEGGRPLGSAPTNRVLATNRLTLRSVNGPVVTVIEGFQATDTNGVRCVYLAPGSKLIGFTLTNGAAGYGTVYNVGGGVCAPQGNTGVYTVISNCVVVNNFAAYEGGGVYGGYVLDSQLIGNSAGWAGGGAFRCIASNCTFTANSAQEGGGAENGTLYNCVLGSNVAVRGGGMLGAQAFNCLMVSNSATDGGGAQGGQLVNCTVVGNSAIHGGGAAADVRNSILYFNNAPFGSNYLGTSVDHCCVVPLPSPSIGNFTNEPLLVDVAQGDFRLQSNSPCINSGRNGWNSQKTDRDGHPRVVAGTVDVGAYEFSTPASVISYAWLQQYGLATDGTADASDADNDGMSNWQEWVAGTDPTNSLSMLQIVSVQLTPRGVQLKWPGADWTAYWVERATSLAPQPTFKLVATNIFGESGYINSYTDTNAASTGSFFYRIGVKPL